MAQLYPTPVSAAVLDQAFRDAHTTSKFLDKPVDEATLREIYELCKWGPTAFNMQPMRLVFVKSAAAKEKLKPCLAEGNRDKTMAAPVTAIVAYDVNFWTRLPEQFPAFPGAKDIFSGNAAAAQGAAFRNGSLGGAYLIIAARLLGLAAGPMSGFDNAKVDEAFFAGTSVKSNFLVNLGYGAADGFYPRGPRLPFEEAVRVA